MRSDGQKHMCQLFNEFPSFFICGDSFTLLNTVIDLFGIYWCTLKLLKKKLLVVNGMLL